MRNNILIAIFCFLLLQNVGKCINKNHLIKPEIIKIHDGDTIGIRLETSTASVRLKDIDCYESTANFHMNYQKAKTSLTYDEIAKRGEQAKILLEKIIKEKEIYFELTGIDKQYGRLIGNIFYKKNNNLINIKNDLIESGFCFQYNFATKE